LQKNISNIEETKARNAKVVSMISKEYQNLLNHIDDLMVISNIHDTLKPIPETISLQLSAYYIAKIRRYDIDKQRNLAKSVTVE
jgi:glucosamine--fructose-6-phosphate aminotransferase (isomerizing)